MTATPVRESPPARGTRNVVSPTPAPRSKPPLAPKPPRSPVPRSPVFEPPRSPVYEDRCFHDGASSNDSMATPSDLQVDVPLTRKNSDLSDLSSPSHGGSSVHSLGSVPRNISTDGGVASSKHPWKQPHVLSRRSPKDIIVVQERDSVEVVKNNKKNNIPQSTADNRTPIVVLLMDPSRKWYELMLLWVDTSIDTVRDVFHATQQKLTDKWKQDYDGFLQLRAGKSNQLINCLGIKKYDITPYEVLVAKPSFMTCKITESCAEHLLKYLKNIGMISQGAGGLLSKSGENSPRRKKKGATAPSVDGILKLSLVARSRIYAPEGIFKHHHAGLFLTFSPPFEPEIASQQQESDGDFSSSFANITGLSIDIGPRNNHKTSTENDQHNNILTPILTESTPENDSTSMGSAHNLKLNQRPLVSTLGRNGMDTGKQRSVRPKRESLVRLKLLGSCFGRSGCVSQDSLGYDWNMPGSSSDYVPTRSMETATTESHTQPEVTDSWTVDDCSFVSHQDSFAPLINRRDDDMEIKPFPIRRNKVTDCAAEF